MGVVGIGPILMEFAVNRHVVEAVVKGIDRGLQNIDDPFFGPIGVVLQIEKQDETCCNREFCIRD